MLHLAGQDIGDRLDSAVRMPWKAVQILLRNIVAEVVQQEERIKLGRIPESESATQMHARPFDRGFRLNKPLHRPNGHPGFSSLRWQNPIAANAVRCPIPFDDNAGFRYY